MKKIFIFLLSFFLFGCEFSDTEIQNIREITGIKTSQEKISEEKNNSTLLSNEELEAIAIENIESKKKEIEEEVKKFNEENAGDENLYAIEKIYDGDTYQVWVDGKLEKVRVLGIDTPEKKGGFRPEGCFGEHASEYAKQKLFGKKVGLLKPTTHENTDKYGRLLRYVFLDGEDFGAHLIEEGYAFSYKKFPHPRRSYYNELEKTAQKNTKGMWDSENCGYWGQGN